MQVPQTSQSKKDQQHPEALNNDSAAALKRRPVSFRAVVLGLLFSSFMCAITPYNDFKIGATYLAGTQFPIGALFVLFVLSGIVNVLIRRIRRSMAFTCGELLTVWSMMLVASGLPSSGLMRYFIPLIAAPAYFSDSTNKYEANVWGHMPDWLKLKDTEAAKAFFTGYPRGMEHIPWAAWAQPLFYWGLLAALFLLASFSVASLLRKQWVENEKFVFPLVTLPLLLAEEPQENTHLVNRIFRTPIFWGAFAIVTCLHTMNGMHQLYPSIPLMTTSLNINEYLTVPPYNQIGWFPFVVYPLVIGISYLLSTEVCFSIWFFFLFYKFQLLLFAIYDLKAPGNYIGYGQTQFHALEAFGGMLSLFCWMMWAMRDHLKNVWLKALGGPRAAVIDDSNEMISYRATIIGIILSYGGIAAWMYAANVSAGLILLSLLMMTLAFVLVGWMVCQAGMIMMQMPLGSVDVLATTMGTAGVPIPSLFIVARAEASFFYDSRELMVPSLLNAARAGETGRVASRSLLKALILSVIVGVIISGVATLWLPYYNGGANILRDTWGYKFLPVKILGYLSGISATPQQGTFGNFGHITGGFVGVLALLLLRLRTGFGLHPIGFLAASTYPVHMLWGSIFVGWFFKIIIQRYGGMKGYRAMLPFFLGLVLGDTINAMIWIIIGYLTGTGYGIMPG